MDVVEIKRRLTELGITPSKGMGQNYLRNPEVCARIVDAIEPESADVTLEIGPGLGALTDLLAPRARKLLLVELEKNVADWWAQLMTGNPQVEVRRMDASKIDTRPFFPMGDVRVIGNLPYSVGSEIIRVLLDHPSPFSRAVFMLQREVAERIAARPGRKAFGALSLLIQQSWHVETLLDVPPDAFYPPPRVHSRVLLFTPRDPASLPVYDKAHFRSVVKRGFAQRRKQMRKQFEQDCDWPAVAATLGFPETARAEELSLEQWIGLSRATMSEMPQDQGQSVDEMFDVVDENDVVIDRRTRGEVHQLGLRHRAIHLFALRSGQILLQRRSHLKDVAPLLWDSSAAGHLDSGEDYQTAARREIAEELGLPENTPLKLIGVIPESEDTGHEFIQLFTTEVSSGKVDVNPAEIDCALWFPLETVAEWIESRPGDFAPGFRTCFQFWMAQTAANRP